MAILNKEEVARYLSSHSLDLTNRTLYISSGSYSDGEDTGVDGQLAERVIKGLHVMDHNFKADDKPIMIQLNCIGGDVHHGLAIYDAIKECKNHVTIKVYGAAMSMGSIICQAGDERIMAPNSRMMLHYGNFGIDDHSKTAIQWAKEEEKMNRVVEDMYLSRIKEKRPKYKRSQLQTKMNFDTVLTPKEAIELGLADKIIGVE